MEMQMVERSAEENAAIVEKLLAEARKADAEAAGALAEARETTANAKSAEARMTQDKIKLALVQECELKRKAGDEYHRVYHFDSQVSPSTVAVAITTLTEWHRLDSECEIEIIFNSGGGDVISGFQLFDFIVDLGDKGHKITTGCTGMAASMAGILVQAGKHRWMSRESWYMIHQAAFGASGKTFDVEDTVEWVKRIQARIVTIFADRSDGKLTKKKIESNWKRKDWWIDSDEAKKFGLVDEIRASSLPGEALNNE